MTEADLGRFLEAQAPVIDAVERELAAGAKTTHWMWFVFPQIAGLGLSERARFFGLSGLNEARRYLADPVLGERLRRHVRLMLRHADRSAESILGVVDAVKFRSCATLFHAAAIEPADIRLFAQALERFYGGEADPATLARLAIS